MDTTGPSPETITTLTYIGALSDQREQIDIAIVEHVRYARIQGASWRMIGVALGTSTQAAWERYNPGNQHKSHAMDDPRLPLDD